MVYKWQRLKGEIMRKINILFILLTGLLLTSCWDYIEIGDTLLLTALGIEKADDSYLITVEIPNPTEFTTNKSGSSLYRVIEVEMDSLSEMTPKLLPILSQIPEWGSVTLIVISKEIAEGGLDKIIDSFLRNGEMRVNAPMVMSLNNSPKELLGIFNIGGTMQSIRIVESLKWLTNQYGFEGIVKVMEVADNCLLEGKSNFLPIIEIVGDAEKGKEIDSTKTTEPEVFTEITGLALFSDRQYVGKLDYNESRVISLLLTYSNYASSLVKTSDCSYGIEIRKLTKEITSDYVDGLPEFDIKLEISATLLQIGCGLIIDNEEIEKIENIIASDIKDDLTKIIRKTQVFQSDILGLGEIFRRSNTEDWRTIENTWLEAYAEAGITIKIEVDIQEFGMITDTVEKEEN